MTYWPGRIPHREPSETKAVYIVLIVPVGGGTPKVDSFHDTWRIASERLRASVAVRQGEVVGWVQQGLAYTD